MKILMLQGYYEPEVVSGLYLVTNLIDELAKFNHKVDVVTPIPTRGISSDIRDKYKNIKLEKKLGGSIKIHRYWLPKENKNNLIRAIRYLLGGILHIIKSLSIESDIILINSTPPTNGIVATIVKKIKKIPVVYILQDIFPDSLLTSNISSKGSIIWKIGRWIEKITYNNVDKIIVVSEDFKLNLLNKNVPKEKIEVVYNWVDEDIVKPVKKKENQLIKDLGLNYNDFYVVYAGNLGNAQNIEIILETAKLTKEQKDIKYLIFGNGVQEDVYKEMARNMNLKNIAFYPLQPYEKVSEVYSLGDVSIVSCKPGFGGSAMPSKTWSIMSTGTAVIANFDEGTELQRIIDENKVGIFIKAGDVNQFKDAILKLHKNKNMCNDMGRNGRKYILNNLSRQSQTSKYIEILKSIKGELDYV